MNDFVLRLDHEDASLARVGGKGAALAKLVKNGFPVPTGFHTGDLARVDGERGVVELLQRA